MIRKYNKSYDWLFCSRLSYVADYMINYIEKSM